jgi:hypothetical protein
MKRGRHAMCVESQAGGVTREQETSPVYLPRTRSGRVSLKTDHRGPVSWSKIGTCC